jgi:hypothetical protein
LWSVESRKYPYNLLTTVEPGEGKIESFFNPPPVNDVTVRSVWWRWTATVSGPIHLDTLGSQVSNVLGVYTGNSVNALAPIVVTSNSGDCVNGEGPNRTRSASMQTTFDAVAGTTYHISLQGSGYNAASSGPIVLTLSGPTAIPFAPENFTANRVADSRIDLNRRDVAVDEGFYEIERPTDGISWLPLHQTNPDAQSYSDFDTSPDSAVFYRLRAVNSVGQSDWATASVDPTTFAQWLERFFSSTSPESDTAFDADPDGDGIPNLLEYALAGNPLVPNSASLPELGVVVLETGHHLTLTFIRARADVTYQVLASDGLGPDSWSTTATNPGQIDINVPVTVTDPQPVSASQQRLLYLLISQ